MAKLLDRAPAATTSPAVTRPSGFKAGTGGTVHCAVRGGLRRRRWWPAVLSQASSRLRRLRRLHHHRHQPPPACLVLSPSGGCAVSTVAVATAAATAVFFWHYRLLSDTRVTLPLPRRTPLVAVDALRSAPPPTKASPTRFLFTVPLPLPPMTAALVAGPCATSLRSLTLAVTDSIVEEAARVVAAVGPRLTHLTHLSGLYDKNPDCPPLREPEYMPLS